MRRGALAFSAAVWLLVLATSPAIMTEAATTTVNDERWERATDAWERGRYPEALADLDAILSSPAAEDFLERIALLTGELYPVTEIATDGRAPRLSASGELVAFETGPLASPITRVSRISDHRAQVVAEVSGVGAAFDPSAQALVYIGVGAGPDRPDALVVRTLATGAERVVDTGGLLISQPLFAANGRGVVFIGGRPDDPDRSNVYLSSIGGTLTALTDSPGHKTALSVDSSGRFVLFGLAPRPPFRARGAAAPVAPASSTHGVLDLETRAVRMIAGASVTFSPDGQRIAWVARQGDEYALHVSPVDRNEVTVVRRGPARIDAPTFSPDSRRLAYQVMLAETWDIFVADLGGTERRLTRDAQHDVLPRFLTNDTLIAMRGEARHRRAQHHHLTHGTETRVFANNTLRTLSPEYMWIPDAAGTRVLIQADRDGDTVSPERGLFLSHLTERVTLADVRTRLRQQAQVESDLRTRMQKRFEPVAPAITRALARLAPHRVREYLKTLVEFDSKHVTQPGNAAAIAYLDRTYRSFGYAVDVQWFAADGHRTANVIAVKRGTTHPEVIYVVSSHFDSVAAGPGADDNSSGGAALLEMARVFADVPLPATLVFASLTGEESGLLGSREFVRRAAEARWHIAGAINNDMIGWSGDSARVDNSIRYSNAGIRDLQHGAAFLFTRLVTFDTRYFRNTDAQAFHDGWGDIVGGFGSYPILANPHYHLASDLLPTVNVDQVTECSRATAATLIALASSPAPVRGLRVSRGGNRITIEWAAAREQDIDGFVVTYGSRQITTPKTSVELPRPAPGTMISVVARNRAGMGSWDAARFVLTQGD